MPLPRWNQCACAGSATLLLLCGSGALAQQTAPVRQLAPDDICSQKVDAILNGSSQNITDDVDWLKSYCDPKFREKAVASIAEATADAAMTDAVTARRQATQQARGDISIVNSQASSANVDVVANSLANMTPASPSVVVISAGHAAPPNHHNEPLTRPGPPSKPAN